MIIKKLITKNYKKFGGKTFEFNDDVNIIVGDNAMGKSSILEAIELATNCSFRGRPLSLEIALELMNARAAAAYLAGDLKHATLPEVVIELFVDGIPEYRGTHNSLTEDTQGITLKIAFDPDLLAKYDELVQDAKNVRTVPIEFFKIEWHDFAGNQIKSLTRKAKSLLIDPSRLHPTYGKSQYITGLLAAALTKDELAHLNLDFRQLKNVFDEQQHVTLINKSLDADKTITNGTLKIIADIAANRGIEASLQLAIDDVAFPLVGKGEQSQVQIKLAIQNKAKAVNFILLEEPENHLSHMNLTRLIKYIEEHGNGLQVFICTHSSYVLNKLSIAKLCLVGADYIRLKDIDPLVSVKIKRLPGYDTLRAVLANKVILVEGPSDELILKKLYLSKHGKLPEEDGIEILVVRGLGFETYLEIVKGIGTRTHVLKDNDNDYKANIAAYQDKYKAYPNIKFLAPTDNNLNSLEPALIAEHGKSIAALNAFAKLILSKQTYNLYEKEPDLAAKTAYLRNWFGGDTGNGKKKVDSAMRIFESDEAINYPAYLAGTFDFA
jgi:putative ATP-dependent endonuclease of OLD family